MRFRVQPGSGGPWWAWWSRLRVVGKVLAVVIKLSLNTLSNSKPGRHTAADSIPVCPRQGQQALTAATLAFATADWVRLMSCLMVVISGGAANVEKKVTKKHILYPTAQTQISNAKAAKRSYADSQVGCSPVEEEGEVVRPREGPGPEHLGLVLAVHCSKGPPFFSAHSRKSRLYLAPQTLICGLTAPQQPRGLAAFR